MKFNWNYRYFYAERDGLVLAINEEPIKKQKIGKLSVKLGFSIDASTGDEKDNRVFNCKIIGIDSKMIKELENNSSMLESLVKELGDNFLVWEYDNAVRKRAKALYGKYPTQKDLAEYLGVNTSAVSRYLPKKKKLMLDGLWLMEEKIN